MKSRWTCALVAGLSLAVACRSERWAGRRVPAHRIADELAAERGAREPASFAIGNDTRYVLGPPVERATATKLVGDEDARTVVIDLPCPPSLAGRTVVATLETRTVGARPRVEAEAIPTGHMRRSRHRERVARCPDEGKPPAQRRIPIVRGGNDAIVTVAVVGLPDARIQTGFMPVQSGASLRVGLGVRSVGRAPAGAAIEFVVDAESPSGDRVSVLRARRAASPGGWFDVDAPLVLPRAWNGSTFRLLFDAAPAHGTGFYAHPLWGNPTIWVPADSTAPPPRNVVLVSIDTLRAGALGVYGYPLPVSPVLDRFAAQGTVFAQAISQASWTVPSHATMLTGTHSCVHLMGARSGAPMDSGAAHGLPVGIRPLAGILRAHGYTTAAFTEDAYMSPLVFQRGFDAYRADSRPSMSRVAGLVESTVGSAVDWLTARPEEPFFLFVHTYQVHAPYTPPRAYAYPTTPPVPPIARVDGTRRAAATADEAKYLGEVRYTDASLAPLLDALDRLALADRTIVVVTSDHGEAFGEHGLFGHGAAVHEEQVWVPLLWRAPNLIAAGRRIPDLIGLVDVTPTILDLVDLERPAWMQGRSLRPQLTMASPPPVGKERILPVEGFLSSGLRGDSWKAVFAPRDRTVRFDLASDPGEHHALPATAVVADEQRRLTEDCQHAVSVLEAEGGAAPSPVAPIVDPARSRKLEALGYVE